MVVVCLLVVSARKSQIGGTGDGGVIRRMVGGLCHSFLAGLALMA